MMTFANLSIWKGENFAGGRGEDGRRGAAFDCTRPNRLVGAEDRDI